MIAHGGADGFAHHADALGGKPEQRPAQKPASPQKQVTKKPALTLLQTDDGDYAAVAGFAVLGAAALAPGAARKRMR